MEGKRFDRMVAGMAAAADRRSAVKGLAAALAGLGLARAAAPLETAAEEVGIEKCGGKRDSCLRNTDCCKGLKCKDGDPDYGIIGHCTFKSGHGGKGDWCKKDSDCDRRFVCQRRRCR